MQSNACYEEAARAERAGLPTVCCLTDAAGWSAEIGCLDKPNRKDLYKRYFERIVPVHGGDFFGRCFDGPKGHALGPRRDSRCPTGDCDMDDVGGLDVGAGMQSPTATSRPSTASTSMVLGEDGFFHHLVQLVDLLLPHLQEEVKHVPL